MPSVTKLKTDIYQRAKRYGLELEATCVGITQSQWDSYMKNAVRANKAAIDRLVKEHLPDLYHHLALDSYNPYNYYRTKTHLILVHSSIEYFLKVNPNDN